MSLSHTSNRINDQAAASIQTLVKPGGFKKVGRKAKKSWEKNRNA